MVLWQTPSILCCKQFPSNEEPEVDKSQRGSKSVIPISFYLSHHLSLSILDKDQVGALSLALRKKNILPHSSPQSQIQECSVIPAGHTGRCVKTDDPNPTGLPCPLINSTTQTESKMHKHLPFVM